LGSGAQSPLAGSASRSDVPWPRRVAWSEGSRPRAANNNEQASPADRPSSLGRVWDWVLADVREQVSPSAGPWHLHPSSAAGGGVSLVFMVVRDSPFGYSRNPRSQGEGFPQSGQRRGRDETP